MRRFLENFYHKLSKSVFDKMDKLECKECGKKMLIYNAVMDSGQKITVYRCPDFNPDDQTTLQHTFLEIERER